MSYSDGTLVKGSGAQVYLIRAGKRRWIPDLATFNLMGYQWGDVQTISDSDLQAIPEITALSYSSQTWAGATALLQQFAPYIWLHSQEQYFPASVEWYLPRVEMIYPQLNVNTNPSTTIPAVVLQQVTDTTIATQTYTDDVSGTTYSSSFTQPGSGGSSATTPFYLDIQSTSTRTGMATIQKGKVISLNNPPVYGAVIDRPDIDSTDLLYGFFYAYNGASMNDPGFVDTHEGDWEHVIVRLNNARTAIVAIFFQAHGSTDTYTKWYFPPKTPDVDTFSWYGTSTSRFVVYASQCGHASYTTSGDHYYNLLRGTDKTDAGTLWDPGQSIIVIDPTIQGWMNYSGCFGTFPVISSMGNPPPGPIAQGWFNWRTDGPATTVSVVVSQAAAKGQDSRVSSNFTLLLPNQQVVWHVTGISSPQATAGITWTVMEDKGNDQPRLEHVVDGTVSSGMLQVHNPNNLYIGRLSYTDPATKKTYNHSDVFTQLGVSAFTIVISVVQATS